MFGIDSLNASIKKGFGVSGFGVSGYSRWAMEKSGSKGLKHSVDEQPRNPKPRNQ